MDNKKPAEAGSKARVDVLALLKLLVTLIPDARLQAKLKFDLCAFFDENPYNQYGLRSCPNVYVI